jgi:outer membrane protein assembly factor BamE
MQKIAIILTTALLLSSCVHKMNVQQGNIIEQNNVSKLHAGMSEEEVKNIMGTPVLINTFRDNRVNYVYTNKPGYGEGTEKTITLIFQGNRLKNMSVMTEQPFGRS